MIAGIESHLKHLLHLDFFIALSMNQIVSVFHAHTIDIIQTVYPLDQSIGVCDGLNGSNSLQILDYFCIHRRIYYDIQSRARGRGGQKIQDDGNQKRHHQYIKDHGIAETGFQVSAENRPYLFHFFHLLNRQGLAIAMFRHKE